MTVKHFWLEFVSLVLVDKMIICLKDNDINVKFIYPDSIMKLIHSARFLAARVSGQVSFYSHAYIYHLLIL